MPATRQARIKARLGLHARPAMQLSALCQKYDGQIRLRKTDAPAAAKPADAKNILDVMILAAGCGEVLVVEVEGEGADAILEAVCDLLESEFDPVE